MGCTVVVNDWEQVSTHGFFAGYNATVWIVIALNTCGGYIVANVVQYTSNVTKAFANGISIILGTIIACILFDFQLTMQFGVGAIIVLYSVTLFNKKKATKQ